MRVLSACGVPSRRMFAPLTRCTVHQLVIVALTTMLHHSITQSGMRPTPQQQHVAWEAWTKTEDNGIAPTAIVDAGRWNRKRSMENRSDVVSTSSVGRRVFHPQLFFGKKAKGSVFSRWNKKRKRKNKIAKIAGIAGSVLLGAGALGGVLLANKDKKKPDDEPAEEAALDESNEEDADNGDADNASEEETLDDSANSAVTSAPSSVTAAPAVASRDAIPEVVTPPSPPVKAGWSTQKKLLVILVPIGVLIIIILIAVSVCLLYKPGPKSSSHYVSLNSQYPVPPSTNLFQTMNINDSIRADLTMRSVGRINPDDL